MSEADRSSDLKQLERELRQKKAEIQAEINSYPAPIAGCDQQFNYLLAQRAELNKKLRSLGSMRESSIKFNKVDKAERIDANEQVK